MRSLISHSGRLSLSSSSASSWVIFAIATLTCAITKSGNNSSAAAQKVAQRHTGGDRTFRTFRTSASPSISLEEGPAPSTLLRLTPQGRNHLMTCYQILLSAPAPSYSYYIPSKKPLLQRRRASKVLRASGKPQRYIGSVRIVEVGARDGLQNEQKIIPVEAKIELIEKLSETGLKNIEAGSFVSPKWVPQMADTSKILSHLSSPLQLTASKASADSGEEGIRFSYLIPNLKGLESALSVGHGIPEIAIFASASEGFSKRNINCSISESLERFKPVMELASNKQIPVRGYVSMVISCPYDGPTDPNQVAYVTKELLSMGCYEVSLGDTNGVGSPETVSTLLDTLINKHQINPMQLAAHFHDTYGQALVNAMTALQFGIRVFDGSVAGLGGCPYAKGATGNVATEDLAYFLESAGYKTGVDLVKLSEVGRWISGVLGRTNGSKVGPAILAMKEKEMENEKEGRKEGEKEEN